MLPLSRENDREYMDLTRDDYRGAWTLERAFSIRAESRSSELSGAAGGRAGFALIFS